VLANNNGRLRRGYSRIYKQPYDMVRQLAINMVQTKDHSRKYPTCYLLDCSNYPQVMLISHSRTLINYKNNKKAALWLWFCDEPDWAYWVIDDVDFLAEIMNLKRWIILGWLRSQGTMSDNFINIH
jgi:hypothetical protein